MKATRISKLHMRCTATACRKRFKGREGDCCPRCGHAAKPNPWANRKPWRAYLCHCDGMWWSIRGAPHKIGTGDCRYNAKRYNEEQVEV